MPFVIDDQYLPATLTAQVMTDSEFLAFCSEHPDLNFEMTAEGELIVMAPTGFDSGARNADILQALRTWAKQDGCGIATDSSTGFVLPNGARRSPDAAWTLKSRIKHKGIGFAHLCPDFVIELHSDSDRLKTLQQKMREYLANGAQLGWLIDPTDRSVTIYRPEGEPEKRAGVDAIQGEGILESFTLNLKDVWDPLA